jgi:hypothetical protein
VNAPTVDRLSLVKDPTTHRTVELMRDRPEIVELVVGLEETTEGRLALSVGIRPTVAERLKRLNHQTTYGEHCKAMTPGTRENRVQVPLLKAFLDEVGDPELIFMLDHVSIVVNRDLAG